MKSSRTVIRGLPVPLVVSHQTALFMMTRPGPSATWAPLLAERGCTVIPSARQIRTMRPAEVLDVPSPAMRELVRPGGAVRPR